MIVWLRRLLLVLISIVAVAGAGFGVTALRFWLRFRNQECRVTPLMYHAIVPDEGPGARYWMREQKFARQMADLRAAGAVTPPLDSIVTWLENPGPGCPFPPNSIVITFDLDGVSRHLELVLPHLVEQGFRAVFFVPLMALDHPPGVTSDALRQMAAAGMTVGSHSEHHYDMRLEQPDSMVASLLRTRERLSAITGQAVTTVSAPGGRYNATVVAGVGRAGFTSFFTSDPCYIAPPAAPRTLCRIEIRGDEGMPALDAVRKPWPVAVQAADWAIKRGVESLVGPRFWGLLHFLRSEAGGPGY